MNVLDAKVINTALGLEIYLDGGETIEIKEIHLPSINHPFYEVQFGINYFLLRKEKHYDLHRNYFGISISHDFSSITIKEAEVESLFAVKSEDEREATKALLGEWLIKTTNYKKCINESIERIKLEEIYTEEDIQQKVGKIKFLEKIHSLKPEDLEKAPIKKGVELEMATLV